MALNSMCAMACSRAARPAGVPGERLGRWTGSTSRGRGLQHGGGVQDRRIGLERAHGGGLGGRIGHLQRLQGA
jgi:hypothetical protein